MLSGSRNARMYMPKASPRSVTSPFGQQLPRALELVATRHAEAEMIEPDAGLVEPIVGRGAAGIGAWAQSQADATIAEKDPGREIRDELESDDVRVERPAALDIRDGQAEMMNRTGGDRRRHGELPP